MVGDAAGNLNGNIYQVFSCHLWVNFQASQSVRGSESKWATFRAFIVEAAAGSYGQEVSGACCGGNLRTSWLTPGVREAVRPFRRG